ncbi:NACHT and WD repeat domain-containing protein [Streptomyces netropsis]|uniref:NACHT and WD repeat domain-containing protein n=1 Tax=Streptomyces netropsis TaxID=55404 RepID=UPI00378E142A
MLTNGTGDTGDVKLPSVVPGEELRRLRLELGVSLGKLAKDSHYTKGYLSRVETGDKPMTAKMAQVCDSVLGTGGVLTRLVAQTTAEQQRRSLLEVCPYRGLAPYSVADAGWLFGRERATTALVRLLSERLSGAGPTMVVAASGTGKSSLLQAGLVPALHRGALAVQGSHRWPVVTMRPGDHPVRELLARVADTVGADEGYLRSALDDSVLDLAKVVHEAVNVGWPRSPNAGAGALDPARLILVVDQFEEAFTLCADTRERAVFVRAVQALSTAPVRSEGWEGAAALVVLGMRADFYGPCLAFPELATALRQGQLPLEPMRVQEIRDAVVRPAHAAGLELEPGLVELILRDLGDVAEGEAGQEGGCEPGALPLLSHALLATWQERREKLLTVEGYQRAGGMAGAVAITAERAYERLPESQQEAARAVLLRLVRVNDDGRTTRRRATREELAHQTGGPAGAAGEVVEAFTRARLLTADAGKVTLAHEAVLRAWPRLRGWIEADAMALHAWQQLSSTARQWEAEKRDAELLPRGSRLTSAREAAVHLLAVVGEVERAFLDAAVAQEVAEREREQRRTRRLYRLLAALAVLLVLALISIAVAVYENDKAFAERQAAESSELAVRATAVSSSRPEVSMLLAASAWQRAHTTAAASAVLSTQAQAYAGRLSGHRDRVKAVVWSPDGRHLLSAGADGCVRMWNPRTHRQVQAVFRGRSPIRALAVARDRAFVAWGNDSGEVTLRESLDGDAVRLPLRRPTSRPGERRGAC